MSSQTVTNRFKPLGEDTIGPYYPHVFVDGDRADLTLLHRSLAVRPRGERINLRGRLLDHAGQPVADALIELWQANSAGVLRTPQSEGSPDIDPYFDGFGQLVTSDGPFSFLTVKPGRIATTSGARAPHITLTIFCDGITRLVTQIFFDDEAEANATDPLLASLPPELQSRLIANKVPSTAEEICYDITIVMRGERETPFFDDLSS